jgi:hypothetical protein
MSETRKWKTQEMSAKSYAHPSHRIAILMAAESPFLECPNCRLRVQFAVKRHCEVIVAPGIHPPGPTEVSANDGTQEHRHPEEDAELVIDEAVPSED